MTPSTCSLQQLRIVSVQPNVDCKGFAHQQSFVVRRQPGPSHTTGAGEQFLDQHAVMGGQKGSKVASCHREPQQQ